MWPTVKTVPQLPHFQRRSLGPWESYRLTPRSPKPPPRHLISRSLSPVRSSVPNCWCNQYLHLWSETTNPDHSPCENQGNATRWDTIETSSNLIKSRAVSFCWFMFIFLLNHCSWTQFIIWVRRDMSRTSEGIIQKKESLMVSRRGWQGAGLPSPALVALLPRQTIWCTPNSSLGKKRPTSTCQVCLPATDGSLKPPSPSLGGVEWVAGGGLAEEVFQRPPEGLPFNGFT